MGIKIFPLLLLFRCLATCYHFRAKSFATQPNVFQNFCAQPLATCESTFQLALSGIVLWEAARLWAFSYAFPAEDNLLNDLPYAHCFVWRARKGKAINFRIRQNVTI